MPSWTISDLLRFSKKKHGSCQVQDNCAWQASELEQSVVDSLYGQVQVQETITAPIVVSFTHVRKRPLDEDDLCEKYIIDALRRMRDPDDPLFRIIPGDAAKHIHVRHAQRKPAVGEKEYFIIEIYPNENYRAD